jgi:hypothetical protein
VGIGPSSAPSRRGGHLPNTTAFEPRREDRGASAYDDVLLSRWDRLHASCLTQAEVVDGYRTASVQSTKMAEHMYAGVGFRDLGRILEYVP